MRIKKVATSESHLLYMARAAVGLDAPDAVAQLLAESKKVGKVGPTAMSLLKETLVKGVILALAHGGGARIARHPQNGNIVTGRLWDRHKKLQLSFSPITMEVLRWLITTKFADAKDIGAVEVKGSPTVADEIFLYTVCNLLVKNGYGKAICPAAVFGRSILCWLGFSYEIHGAKGAAKPPDAKRVATALGGPLVPVIESMQRDLGYRWQALELSKRDITECSAMIDLGTMQDKLLTTFLDTCEKNARQDLSLFLMEAAMRLLPRPIPGFTWVGGLDQRGTLLARTSARRAAGAFLQSVARLNQWAQDFRLVNFFEENYGVAQAFLIEWERFGDIGWQSCEGVLRDLASLDGGLGVTA